MPIPQPEASGMFDYPSDQDQWSCQKRGQVFDRHGSLHRSIAGVLCVLESAGRTRRCGTTRRLGSESSRGWVNQKLRRVRRPAESLHRFISPRLSAEACAPVRLRNSSRCFSVLSCNFCKRCIRTNKCKLRRVATIRFHIVRTLLAFSAPCCQ